ncbi:SWI/SNF and RSC complexes subunit ssr3 [Nosema granulosis]|uniref:SWI/SNF and RSC complexes subunit ssr3 n=1 Tax=Nosema granulosis TaxID=83296 RepID=A0A9P6H0M1_9MICR|nr:SWI/SNF and RSC complexes subunit ssr3 [Nosema granulosis]
MFENLKKVESKIDSLCLSKRLHTEAEHLKRIKCVKTLRLYVKSSIEEETFIRIDTRVINDFKNQEEKQTEDLIKRLCVVFNSDLEPSIDYYRRISGEDVPYEDTSLEDTEVHEWNNTEDGYTAFELRSKTRPKNIRILIEFENRRDVYKLSPCLQEITEKYTDTKPNVITNIWKYIHKNALIKPGETEVVSDEKLRMLSGREKFEFTELPEIIINHLCPIDFLVIDIPTLNSFKDIFDVPIEVDDLFHLPRIHSKDVYAYEKKIEMMQEFKKRLEEKRDVLVKFGENPMDFINRWICLEATDYHSKTHFLLDANVQEMLYELIKQLPTCN